MGKKITAYRKSIDALLAAETAEIDWEKAAAAHLTQMGFYQRERLIHLLVTLGVSILAMLSLILLCVETSLAAILLFLVFVALLVPYLFHYRRLENEVQKMISQYEAMCQRR